MMLGILASYEHIHIKVLCISTLIPMYNCYNKGKTNLMKLAILKLFISNAQQKRISKQR